MMNTILAVIWCLVKLGFIAVSALLLIALIIIVLHPIVIDGKARLTERGQKGYIKLSYLFNIIGLEVEASKISQRIYLRTFRKKKLLYIEKAPKKNKIDDNPNKNYDSYIDNENIDINSELDIKNEENDIVSEPDAQNEDNYNTKFEKDIISETNNDNIESSTDEFKVENEIDSKIIKNEEDAKQEETVTKDEDLNSSHSEESEKQDIIDSETNGKVSIDNENEKSKQNMDESEPTLESDEHVKIEIPKVTVKEEGFFEKIRRLLRKFKSDANRRIDEIKGKLRLFRKHWRICKPALKRFWNRFKGSVEFKDGLILLRYSLPKPHLTGMLYGALSGLYDLFRRLKTEFVLIPVFNGKSQTFYCKIAGRIVLRPFWLLWALFCLLFEFSLYKEYYALYKFMREKKQNKKRSGAK